MVTIHGTLGVHRDSSEVAHLMRSLSNVRVKTDFEKKSKPTRRAMQLEVQSEK